LWEVRPFPGPTRQELVLTVLRFPGAKPPETAQLEPEQLIDLVAENAGLRAALAVAEGASLRRELVSQELKHRIGNLIAVVQAIARKSFRDAEEVRVTDFNSRLSALAAAQTLLIDAETQPTTLLDVTRLALAPHISNSERLAIYGPYVALSGRCAHALTLALHELATNAAKYGALSQNGGKLEVKWVVKMDAAGRELTLDWIETLDKTLADSRVTASFGMRLIKNAISHDLRGACAHDLESGGLTCKITFPF
jgi:two-component sensor histidine kinase